MFQTNYRLAFIQILLELFTPPVLAAFLLSRFALSQSLSGPLLTGAFYVATVLAYCTVKVQYDVYSRNADAARRGAVVAPEVKGRLPGNIDVIFKMTRAWVNGYAVGHLDVMFNDLNTDTINLRLLWRDMIVTRDHNVMQTVLATGFTDFAKGPIIKLRLFGLFGNGIFNNDGEEWKAHRALTRPFFARERVRDFDLFDRYSDKVIDIFRSRVLAGESVDVQDVFGRFTLDAAGEFLFGTTKLNTLDLPLSRAGQAKLGTKGSQPEGEYGGFVRAFEEIQTVLPLRFRRSILWPAFEFFNDTTKEHNKVIDDWIMPLVQTSLEQKSLRRGEKLDLDEGCLTDHIAQSTEDIKVIRDELLNILLAARDTTAALLTFLLYFLSLHPDVTQKLRAEILAQVPSGAPTFDDIRQLKYLRACLNETLRLFPPVPSNERASTRPSLLPSAPGSKPIYMPGPHVAIVYSDLLMQRRTDLWGPDAYKFDPERWIDPERLKRLTVDPFKFLPFNAGPRICLGQNFAYNESSFLVVRLLQAFDAFELRQKEDAPAGSLPPAEWQQKGGRHTIEQVWPRVAVTLYSKGGMWIRMRAAKANE